MEMRAVTGGYGIGPISTWDSCCGHPFLSYDACMTNPTNASVTRLILDFLYAAADRAWMNPDINVSGALWIDMNLFFGQYAQEVAS